jgi:hypothetical protein
MMEDYFFVLWEDGKEKAAIHYRIFQDVMNRLAEAMRKKQEFEVYSARCVMDMGYDWWDK